MAFENLKNRLEQNGFTVSVFSTGAEAADYLDREIDGKTVGMGGSMTLAEMGMTERLASHNTICSHWIKGSDPTEELRKAMTTEVYLLSANAIAEDTGEILNIDGSGNRVSSSLFGHKKVYFVAGKNKVSPDYETALNRLRNVVAPKNAQRLKRNTPCAVNADKCYNCSSPDRICNALVVFYKKIKSMDMEVVLIDEEIGY